MEIEHGKTWSYIALIIAFAIMLLYIYSGIYAFLGVMIGFLGLIFMAAVYLNLYEQYKILYVQEIERDAVEKRKLAKFKSKTPKTQEESDEHG